MLEGLETADCGVKAGEVEADTQAPGFYDWGLESGEGMHLGRK